VAKNGTVKKSMVENKPPHDPRELIAVVDARDRVIGRAQRKKVHVKRLLHRESAVLLFNKRSELLLQKRRDSGLLDFSASGHFAFNETYLQGAVREVQEELGLKIPKSKFVKVCKQRILHGVSDRFLTLFEVNGDYDVKNMVLCKDEVKSVKYYSIPELKKIMKLKPEKMTQSLQKILKIYFEKTKRWKAAGISEILELEF